jgi:hypothetical protein
VGPTKARKPKKAAPGFISKKAWRERPRFIPHRFRARAKFRAAIKAEQLELLL